MTDLSLIFYKIPTLMTVLWVIWAGVIIEGAIAGRWGQLCFALVAIFFTTLAILYRLAGGG